ncbi:MAG: DUF5058 family protein [Oscillospiraceae bacterium]|nr:DUF5058 family protein [Oscillospiraceae bacterium]
MSYFTLAGDTLTYLLVAGGVLYIAALTALFLHRSWRRALHIGYTRAQLRRVVKGALSCTLLPAAAVVIGFFSLAPLLGIPLSWWRLSIVGNTVYELMAAQMSLGATGVAGAAGASAETFVLVMYVMTIGILGGMVCAVLFAPRIQRGTLNLRRHDPHWGALGAGAFVATIFLVMIVPLLLTLSVSLLTLLTSAALSAALRRASRRGRLAWLPEFAPVLCMLAAMASSLLWTALLS